MVLLGIPDNPYSIAYDTARLAYGFSRPACKFNSIAYGIARHACKLKRITNGLPIGWCLTKRNKQFGETPTCIKNFTDKSSILKNKKIQWHTDGNIDRKGNSARHW